MPDTVAVHDVVDLVAPIRRGLAELERRRMQQARGAPAGVPQFLAATSPEAVDLGVPLSAAAPVSIAGLVSRGIPPALVNLARAIGAWAGPAGLVANQLVAAPNTPGVAASNNRIATLWRFLRARHPEITSEQVEWLLDRYPNATPVTRTARRATGPMTGWLGAARHTGGATR